MPMIKLAAKSGMVLGAFLYALEANAADLRVIVEGIASSSGTIVAGLYSTSENYDQAVSESSTVLVNDPKRMIGVSLRPTAEVHTIAFSDLQPGVYAVIVFHDENDNGKLDKNAVGLPVEAYAISNNARGILRAPSVGDALVHVDREDKTLRLVLQYPRRPSERP